MRWKGVYTRCLLCFQNGNTALDEAAWSDCVEVAALLIARGADVNKAIGVPGSRVGRATQASRRHTHPTSDTRIPLAIIELCVDPFDVL